jgi:glycosyltransferase involved in cell wall biosynthesis
MHVCLVTLDSPQEARKDGIAVHVFELAHALRALNAEVWVIGFNTKMKKERIVEDKGVRYLSIPNKNTDLSVKMIQFMRRVPRHLQKLENECFIDVFHGHGGYAGPIAYGRTQGLKGAKIATIHTLGVEEQKHAISDLWLTQHFREAVKKTLLPPQFFLNRWGKWVYQNMDAIISVTEYNRRRAQREYDIPLTKNVVIPNGVNYHKLHRFAAHVKYKDVIANGYQILCFGRLSPRKGVQTLLRAIPHVLQSFPHTKLSIVGEGDYRKYLQNLAQKLRITRHAAFKGFLSKKQLIQEIIQADIIVIPSYFEGLPLTLLESMALQKPVIISAVTGISEIARDGQTAILFTPGDSTHLANKIKLLLNDSVLRDNIARNAERFIKENLTWDKIAVRTLEVYKTALDG